MDEPDPDFPDEELPEPDEDFSDDDEDDPEEPESDDEELDESALAVSEPFPESDEAPFTAPARLSVR